MSKLFQRHFIHRIAEPTFTVKVFKDACCISRLLLYIMCPLTLVLHVNFLYLSRLCICRSWTAQNDTNFFLRTQMWRHMQFLGQHFVNYQKLNWPWHERFSNSSTTDFTLNKEMSTASVCRLSQLESAVNGGCVICWSDDWAKLISAEVQAVSCDSLPRVLQCAHVHFSSKCPPRCQLPGVGPQQLSCLHTSSVLESKSWERKNLTMFPPQLQDEPRRPAVSLNAV